MSHGLKHHLTSHLLSTYLTRYMRTKEQAMICLVHDWLVQSCLTGQYTTNQCRVFRSCRWWVRLPWWKWTATRLNRVQTWDTVRLHAHSKQGSLSIECNNSYGMHTLELFTTWTDSESAKQNMASALSSQSQILEVDIYLALYTGFVVDSGSFVARTVNSSQKGRFLLESSVSVT